MGLYETSVLETKVWVTSMLSVQGRGRLLNAQHYTEALFIFSHLVWEVSLELGDTLQPVRTCLLRDEFNIEERTLPRTIQVA